jgi:hypothetical protein
MVVSHISSPYFVGAYSQYITTYIQLNFSIPRSYCAQVQAYTCTSASADDMGNSDNNVGP